MEAARPATLDDLDVLTELAADAIDELSVLRGGEVWRARSRAGRVRETLAADLDDPEVRVVAGTIDEAVIGYACCRAETLNDGSLLGVIDDLYVVPGARAVGVGEALMNDVEDWARTKGCFGLDSLALPGDRDTKNFFETFGLKARLLVVHRSLQ